MQTERSITPSLLPRGLFSAQPAIPLFFLLVAGILLHPLVPDDPRLLLLLIGAATAMAALCLHRPVLCSALLSIALLLAGIGLARQQHFQFPSDHIAHFAGDEPRLAQLKIKLLDQPKLLVSSFGQPRPLPPKQTVTVQVIAVKTISGWMPASGELPVMIDEPRPHLGPGQILQAVGMLQRPSPAMNPGQFDWASYYRQQRVLATLTVPRAGDLILISDPGPSILSRFQLKTRRLLASGYIAGNTIDEALLQAMLLGDRDPKLRSVQNEFEKAGAAYHLSASGLHIAILTGLIFWICRTFLLRPRLSLLITLTFVLLYSLASLPSHSGSRWIILYFAAGLAILNHRPTNRFQLLALAGTAMLLCNPLDLYSAGFQFCLAAVIALALFLPRIQELLLGLRDPHTAAAPQELRTPPARSALNFLIGYVVRTGEFLCVVWIATLPLVACYSGQLSSWALLGGIIVLPIAFIALLGGLFKILLTLALPAAAHFWADLSRLPVTAMRHVVAHLARLPGGNIPLAAPPLWLIALFYCLLLLPLIPTAGFWVKRRRWLLRAGPPAAMLIILVLPLWSAVAQPHEQPQTLRITLLSLGAGQCAVLEPPGGQPILFDAGSSSISDLLGKVVGPFLRVDGRRHVDQIFLSHGDYDHISAAAEIASAYGVHGVYISPHFRPNAESNIPDQMLLETLEKLNLPPYLLSKGDHLDLGGGTVLDVLWPPALGNLNSNNSGLVLRLTYAGRRILFPADIQDPALAGVLQNPLELKADVLIAAHHGSSEILTLPFLKAVDPALILSSNAWRLTSKQKRFDALVGHTPLYRTSKCGAITISIDRDGKISLSTFLENGRPK